MRPSIPSPPVLSFPHATFTTFVTLATDTPPSSTVQRMRLWADSFHESHTLRRPHVTRRRGLKRMTTGSTGTHPRRTVSDVDAAATPILSTSRARRAAVWRSGLMLLADGPAHRALHEKGVRKYNQSNQTLDLGHDGNGHEGEGGCTASKLCWGNYETKSDMTESEISA